MLRPAAQWMLAMVLAGVVVQAQTNTPVTAEKPHALVPNDVVEVKVYRQPDLETRARLAADGTVTLPLLGAVKLGGLTAEEARVVVRDLLAQDYLVNPQVTLTIVEYAKNLFTVAGEVQRPGAYEVPAEQGLSLRQAIALAGGPTRSGASGKVVVQRIEQGQKKTYRPDTNATGPDEKGAVFQIQSGDAITVGEKAD
jgi:polysaccharide export outer membrane protein